MGSVPILQVGTAERFIATFEESETVKQGELTNLKQTQKYDLQSLKDNISPLAVRMQPPIVC